MAVKKKVAKRRVSSRTWKPGVACWYRDAKGRVHQGIFRGGRKVDEVTEIRKGEREEIEIRTVVSVPSAIQIYKGLPPHTPGR